jgi:YD repeat-containing protein
VALSVILDDQVTASTHGRLTFGFDYDALDRMSRRTLANSVPTDWTYNAAGRLATLISKRGATTLDSHT